MENIPRGWEKIFKKKEDLLDRIFAQLSQKKDVYPEDYFRAFRLVAPFQIRCIIIGQDPYHGPNQANGLAFSVNKGLKIPPSLKNIYKELQEDAGIDIPNHGDLTKWAKEGILMLNTILSVEKGKLWVSCLACFSQVNVFLEKKGWKLIDWGV